MSTVDLEVLEALFGRKIAYRSNEIAAGQAAVKLLAQAWDAGHQTRWRRGPDECQCWAYASIECACGRYGTGVLLSLNDNPYRPEQSGKTTSLATPGGYDEQDGPTGGSATMRGRP